MIILSCIGCHLHWLAVVLLPVALWVMKIFRHKKGKCPCDCHVTRESLNNEVDELLDIEERFSHFSPETRQLVKENHIKAKELIRSLDKGNKDGYIEWTAKVARDSKTGKSIKMMIPKSNSNIECAKGKCETPEACSDYGGCYHEIPK